MVVHDTQILAVQNGFFDVAAMGSKGEPDGYENDSGGSVRDPEITTLYGLKAGEIDQ